MACSSESTEYVALVRAALAAKEREALEVVKDDLSQWLTQLLQRPISPSDFMNDLDTGVELCKLVEMVQRAAKEKGNSLCKLKFRVPMKPLSCNTALARSGSSLGEFHSRSNTSNFIDWCRNLGVEEALIFESEGLVLHKDEKRVILCLLDVARYAERVGLPPPQLVRLEREIEMLEEGSSSDDNDIEENTLILLKDICKIDMDYKENGNGADYDSKENGSTNGFNHHNNNGLITPTASPKRLTPSSASPTSSPTSSSPRHSTSRIPVRTSGSSVKYSKSPSPRSRSSSVPSKAELRKRWRRSGEPKGCSGREEGKGTKQKESEEALTRDARSSVPVGSPGKRLKVGGSMKKGSVTKPVTESETEALSTASVEERVMKQVKQCTCQNKIVVISKGNGKFLVKGASGRAMTVYARVSECHFHFLTLYKDKVHVCIYFDGLLASLMRTYVWPWVTGFHYTLSAPAHKIA